MEAATLEVHVKARGELNLGRRQSCAGSAERTLLRSPDWKRDNGRRIIRVLSFIQVRRPSNEHGFFGLRQCDDVVGSCVDAFWLVCVMYIMSQEVAIGDPSNADKAPFRALYRLSRFSC